PGNIYRVKVLHTVTGPTTLTLGALNPRPVRRVNGSELEAGDVVAGQIACLVDDGTELQLMNFFGPIGGGGDTVNNTFLIHIPYCHDSGITNQLVGSYSPAITSVAEGDLILIKLIN